MKVINISRKRWLRGGNAGTALPKYDTVYGERERIEENAYLYSAANKCMCCLGFVCREARLKVDDISNVGSPGSLYKDYATVPELLKPLVNKNISGFSSSLGDSKLCAAMIRVNDDVDITAKVRETKLKKLARKAGMIFKFVA